MKNAKFYGAAFVLCLSLTNLNAQIESCVNPINLVINGDFSKGYTGFTTGNLSQICNKCTAKSYCVGDDTHDKCTQKSYFTGNGDFLIVDGYDSFTAPYQEFWGQTINGIVPNTDYTISFRVRDQYQGANFKIRIMINNQFFDWIPNFPSDSWTTYSYTWNSGGVNGSIPFSLEINGSLIRDFAIDDIFFGYCECEVDAEILVSAYGDCTYGFSPYIINASRNIIGYYWDFGDGTTSEATSPQHQYSLGGTYRVCLTIIAQDKDGCCTFEFCTPIDVEECFVEGKRDLSNPESSNAKDTGSLDLNLYPNPNDGELTVVINSDLDETTRGMVHIYDVTGKLVLQINETLQLQPGSNSIFINTKNLNPGVYELKVNLNQINKSFTQKFMMK